MLKTWITGTALVMMAAVPAVAQSPRAAEADPIRARQSISMMEGVLERAVMNGADNLLRQVDTVMPDAAMLTGAPQVRGFRLDNYGVFFDVEVPALRLSIAWIVRSMQSGNLVASSALADLKAAASRIGPGDRERLAQAIERLELALGVTSAQPLPRVAPRGSVSAATAFQSSAAAAPPAVSDNPDELWTREVKTALIEAMLGYSGPLAVGDDEWLTVAARDNVPPDPLVPGDTVDFSTVLFRVKGSDLAALHSRRLSMDEARKRVEVREY